MNKDPNENDGIIIVDGETGSPTAEYLPLDESEDDGEE